MIRIALIDLHLLTLEEAATDWRVYDFFLKLADDDDDDGEDDNDCYSNRSTTIIIWTSWESWKSWRQCHRQGN